MVVGEGVEEVGEDTCSRVRRRRWRAWGLKELEVEVMEEGRWLTAEFVAVVGGERRGMEAMCVGSKCNCNSNCVIRLVWN